LAELVQQEERVTHWISAPKIEELFDVQGYTGIAASRAHETAARIKQMLAKP
jgi:hypothetical protein